MNGKIASRPGLGRRWYTALGVFLTYACLTQVGCSDGGGVGGSGGAGGSGGITTTSLSGGGGESTTSSIGGGGSCVPIDDGNPCTLDDCVGDMPAHEPLSDGSGCDDDDACTHTDVCKAGVCKGESVVCEPLDACHVAGVCSPATGCSNPSKPDGDACDDGDACTQTDTCQTGVCMGMNPIVCGGGLVCVVGACAVCPGDIGLPSVPSPSVQGSAQVVVSGDLNSDGRLDLVLGVANPGADDVSVLFGLGNGTFTAAVSHPIGEGPVALSVADLNGDGEEDLAVVNGESDSVSVLFGLGDGSFGARVDYATAPFPKTLAIADLNGDGALDLALAGSDHAGVMLNQGDGAFAGLTEISVGVDSDRPEAIAAVDLNADGIIDLAIASLDLFDYQDGSLSVRLGQGNGTFAPSVNYAVGPMPAFLRAADLSGDGRPDLLVASAQYCVADECKLSVLINEGNGAFSTPKQYQARGRFDIADLNSDGKLDLAFADGGNDGAEIRLNLGDGSFGLPISQPAPGSNDSGAAGRDILSKDLNADGKADLVATTFIGATLLLGRGDATFALPASKETLGGSYSVKAADLNGDGHVDLVAPWTTDPGIVRVALNLGDGTFADPTSSFVGGYPWEVLAADLDGDGKLDLATANAASNDLSVLLNQGDGTFAAEASYSAGLSICGLTAADLDGDGARDLAVAACDTGDVRVLFNLGNGVFAAPVDYVAGMGGGSLLATDLNGDGLSDLVVGNQTSEDVSVLLNQGNGTFGAPLSHAIGSPVTSVAAADLDGDGSPDLAIASAGSLRVLMNLGDGSFAPPIDHAVKGAWKVTTSDLDGDGHAEILLALGATDHVAVLRNQGDGTFGDAIYYPAGQTPSGIDAGDLNGDGRPDIVVATQNVGVGVLLSTCILP